MFVEPGRDGRATGGALPQTGAAFFDLLAQFQHERGNLGHKNGVWRNRLSRLQVAQAPPMFYARGDNAIRKRCKTQ